MRANLSTCSWITTRPLRAWAPWNAYLGAPSEAGSCVQASESGVSRPNASGSALMYGISKKQTPQENSLFVPWIEWLAQAQ